MKIPQKCFSAALVLSVSIMAIQGVEIYNFSNLPGTSIQFNGTTSSFQFNATNGNLWSITTESGGTGAVGLVGSFSGGPWTYGSITTVGSIQYATVNPLSATLTINDGTGYNATADVSWVDVTTYGGSGYLNVNLDVNLFNLAYSGTNVDLLNFFSAPAGELILSFTYNPAMTLTQLTTGSGPYTAAFSGTLESVPEPGTLGICGLGLALLGRRIFKR